MDGKRKRKWADTDIAASEPRRSTRLKLTKSTRAIESASSNRVRNIQPPPPLQSSSGTTAEPHLERGRLSATNLEKLNRICEATSNDMGGRDRKRSASATKTSFSTTTDIKFGAQLNENNVFYDPMDTLPPDDLKTIKEILDRPRESKSPDAEDYKQYAAAAGPIYNEYSTQTGPWTLIWKLPKDGYHTSGNLEWSNVDNELTPGLSDARPDVMEYFLLREYSLDVRAKLAGELDPTGHGLAMPSFCAELKSHHGSMEEARLQSSYDGALMVHGAKSAHELMGKPMKDFYNKTQALTATFNGTIVNIFCHHAIEVKMTNGDMITQYHQYLCFDSNARDTFEGFKAAVKHARNAQDLGRKIASDRKDALWNYSNAQNLKRKIEFPMTPPETCPPETNPSKAMAPPPLPKVKKHRMDPELKNSHKHTKTAP